MKNPIFILSVAFLGLASARAGETRQQPELSANDLAWHSGMDYVKAFCEATDPDRPHLLRLILQTKGSPEVVLIPKLEMPDFWKEKPIEFLFIVSSQQPDGKHKIFIGVSGDSGKASFAKEIDAFKSSQIIFVNALHNPPPRWSPDSKDYRLIKGRHVLMHGDGGPTAGDAASEDYKVRLVLEAS